MAKNESISVNDAVHKLQLSLLEGIKKRKSSYLEERCSVLNSEKLDEIMGLFEGLSLNSKEDLGRNGDLGFSELKIQEKANMKAGEVSLEEWIGPSNAIEGYVPQKDRISKPLRSKNHKEGYKPNDVNSIKGKNVIFNEMDFKSTIITQDEYSISKMSSGSVTTVAHAKSKELKEKGSHKKLENQFTILEIAPDPMQSMLKEPKEEESGIVTTDKLGISCAPSHPSESDLDKNAAEAKEEFDDVEADHFSATKPKPSLKSSGAKKLSRSVTWADERTDGADNRNLCEVRELENTKEGADKFSFPGQGDDGSSVRFASAEACVIALSQAAEAVSRGESDVSDAVSEAGIIILPPPHDMDIEESQVNPNVLEPEPTPSKWPGKPGVPNYNLFDSEDSWYDGPPEEFSLTLSPFATMWMSLFAWISSSSLAYIYGRDDSFHEEYLFVNGREYPRKIVLMDGRSSEIKQTLSGCLARALPGLVTDLRLPTPISILEQGMGCLLDTMSFVDPLPPFRMKQWQVIVLLFIDALSVSRIPALTPHITSRMTLLYK
ncbi:hypothetical protein Acr_19g0001960 [Actinidia rufa]|uniref:RNA polymerase II subunit B1 CTD phosphatase RPAP2 homolog n=1 Tax=Actinidia rufa TaxID=165716 RepID=A0A7J0G8Z5_9ERIC|nr:hypothetical protein Acr_19g0001960 [Actinidia rufa]